MDSSAFISSVRTPVGLVDAPQPSARELYNQVIGFITLTDKSVNSINYKPYTTTV
jgi:hypothetical protein